MGIVRLPVARFRLGITERSALKRGVAAPRPGRSVLRVLEVGKAGVAAHCARCAAPLELGAVTRGLLSYCSIECSLGDDQPA